MTFSIQEIPFRAVWNRENGHLKTALLEKIHRVFFYFLHRLASKAIVPASHMIPKKEVIKSEENFYNTHKQQFTIKKILLKTPDGIKLRATLLQHKKAAENAPVVICCQPNLATTYHNNFSPLIDQAVYEGKLANYLFFDYRECGLSKGTIVAAKDLVIDADSVYQFAKDYLKVPENNIHIAGSSLGGGVACALKKLHGTTEGRLFIDRSFTSIEDTVYALFGGKGIGQFFKYLLRFLGWNHLDTKKNLTSIRSPVLITYHKNDEVIKARAQLSHENLINRQNNIQLQELDRSLVTEYLLRNPPKEGQTKISANLHCHPLSFFPLQEQNHADELAVNFLLSSAPVDNEAIDNEGKKFIQTSQQNEREKFYTYIGHKYFPGTEDNLTIKGAYLFLSSREVMKKELKEFTSKRFFLASA